jgi:hypothetical protein
VEQEVEETQELDLLVEMQEELIQVEVAEHLFQRVDQE